MERTKEMLRRLDLPPDPTLKSDVDAAFGRHKTCMLQAAKNAIKSGKTDNSEIVKHACKACDRTLVAKETAFFRANSHRYMEPSLENDIAKARNDCGAFEIMLRMEAENQLESDPKENQAPPVSVAQFGGWTITGETKFSGALVYKASLPERSNPAIRFEVSCRPASKNYYGWVSYPVKPPLRKSQSFVTFATDGGPPDQISVEVQESGFIVTDLFFRLVSPVGSANKQVLFVNVQGIKLTFDVAGAPLANLDLVQRCRL
ncbi:hypothetical protein [Bradyrhizobium sp. AZCC 2289]|uniref:hypothetical protein n=1 Tax=Bradyrhizobium sp. AZCC 2289 TaxID=3117026 RepID=UPI002FF1B743